MPNLPLFSAKFYAGIALIFSAGLCACQSPEIAVEDIAFETLTVRPDEPPIAKIDGTYLYASDVSRHAEAQDLIAQGELLPKTDPRFDKALQELIDQRLLALSSLEQNLHKEGSVQRRVSQARERILSSAALENHLAKTVTEQSIRDAYDRQVKLGRKTDTYEMSRSKIKALLTRGEIQQYLISLREQGELEVLNFEADNNLEIENE